MFEASCHCGNVQFKATDPPESLTSCNCSICHRIGALWAYYPAKDVELTLNQSQGIAYSWGEKKFTFHTCDNCGSTTHYTSKRKDGTNQVAINARMAEISSTENIRIRYFDGAKSWKYVNE
ncbi:MAG: aldehyde-activating protein [Moraxellaceae bacterium]|nr:MAG: aldehyde-activating protein [Moraxellaceae bacterium]